MKTRPFVIPAIALLLCGNAALCNPTSNNTTLEDHAPQAEQYIKQYYRLAVQEMERTLVPASITLAQGMLESGFGTSELAQRANNHFGIKCHKGWTGDTYSHESSETLNGKTKPILSCFRSYGDVLESFKDHSDFLASRSNYSFLFQSNTKDYKSWAKGLSKAGYATDPNYAKKLITTIEMYNLSEFDQFQSPELSFNLNYNSSSEFNNDLSSLKTQINNLESLLQKSASYKSDLEQQLHSKQSTLNELKIQQQLLKQELDAKINNIHSSLNAQNELIGNLEARLSQTENIQKSMLKSDPMRSYFNADGSSKQHGAIFPAQQLNSDGIFYQSGKKATLIRADRNLVDIAQQHAISYQDLLKYNDLEGDVLLDEGYYIYLEPKASQLKSAVQPHQIKRGETMHSIAQLYGIKLSKLHKKNHLIQGEEPKVGEFVFLNKNNDKKPELRYEHSTIAQETNFNGGGIQR